MPSLSLSPSPLRKPHPAALYGALALVLLALVALALRAQVGGDRGIAPIAASSDIHVTGIKVDTKGETPEEARQAGWEEATRKAWEKIDGPDIPDSELESLVSAIVIEREQLGPKRYIATLGVIFDRSRAGRYLGGQAEVSRSAPMLLVPVTMTAGVQLVYEMRNPWQRAWAEYQTGASRIDYVRPSGAGGESLLITYGQTKRRSRTWWRNVLDQFGAADVLVPIAHLRYTYPGGPVEGRFTARYGPDSRYLDSFTMTARSPDELAAMLDRAVTRFNAIFERALAEGKLRPDPTLDIGTPELSPELLRLIELGRAAAAQAAAADDPRPGDEGETITSAPVETPPPEGSVALYTVQFASPDASAFDVAVAGVRGADGVRAAGIRSTAIGGTSVMTVSFAGSIGELAEELRDRGFDVRQANNALFISR